MVSKRRSSRKLLASLGVALVASLALSAVGGASASAATQHWYAGGVIIPQKTPTSFEANGAENPYFTVRWLSIEVKCLETGSGTLENPAGGLAGKASGVQFKFENCTVLKPEPSNCSAGAGFPGKMVGEATEFGGKPALSLAPAIEPYALVIKLEGGKCGVRGEWRFTGGFTGINNSASRLDFTEASSGLFWGKKPVTLTGSATMKTTAGSLLTLAP